MISMSIVTDGDGAWPDLDGKDVQYEDIAAATVLAGGMESGAPSVAVRIDLDDGRVVVGQTSLALFLSAADVFKTRHGDPRQARP